MKTQLFAFSFGLMAVALMFVGCADTGSGEEATDGTEQVNAMVGGGECSSCCTEGQAAKSCCSEGDVAAKSCCSEGETAAACTDCDGKECCGKCEGETQTISTEGESCSEGCDKCAEGKEEECKCGDEEKSAE